MRRMLVSRISRRVLAEHHIVLSEIHAEKPKHSAVEPHVGIIFTGLNVKKSVDKCAWFLRERPEVDSEDSPQASTEWPEVIVDGYLDTTFSYIREHLE